MSKITLNLTTKQADAVRVALMIEDDLLQTRLDEFEEQVESVTQKIKDNSPYYNGDDLKRYREDITRTKNNIRRINEVQAKLQKAGKVQR